MGLREKVTITLVIIALTQIACRHCMPSTPNKASLKRYLNDLKPVKNNIVPTPYSQSRINKTPKQTFGKTVQNGRISQNSLPNKSLYKTYNFPENEYPLDNAPRDAFGMNYNDKYLVNNLQKCDRNLGGSAINDLKKEMKMKRKILSNRQLNNDNCQLQRESTNKFAPSSDSIHLFDSETFPEVQYPLNTMETWGPNYWNYMSYRNEKPLNGFEQQMFNQKPRNGNNQPFTRLTKTTANKFLQPYDKLKEEQMRTSTENSKRSNAGQKGMNFTKTATCEKVSDDFITASLQSNIPGHSTETKKTIKSTDITPNSENTCPVTEYSYHLMPIPYRVIEKNSENTCPVSDLKIDTEELQDMNSTVIAQTLQLIQEILLNDDASSETQTENFDTKIDNDMSNISYDIYERQNIPPISMENVDICTITSTEKISLNDSNDKSINIFQNNNISHPTEITIENDTIIATPLSVRLPLSFTEPITYGTLTNAPTSVNVIPGSTSIIIIPMNNNAVRKSQSHIIESTSDTPIILYIPTTQSTDISSQTMLSDQNDSLTGEKPVPNIKPYNDVSDMAPLHNDSPSSIALVSELLNGISDSGSSLPMYETLPTNSMCYNNENSPSSTKEKSFSNHSIYKSLIDDKPFVNPTCNLESPKNQSKENYSKADTLPPITDFEHPLFDFAGSNLASLSHGPYNNILNNELPISVREINSNQQIYSDTSKDLFIPTQNEMSECTQKNNSESWDETLSTPLIEAPSADLSVPHTPISVSETVFEILPIITDANLPPEFTETAINSKQEITDMQLLIFNSSPKITDHLTLNTALLPELYKVRQLIDKVLSSEIHNDSKLSSLDTTLSSITDSDCLPLSINDTLLHNQTCPDNSPLIREDKTLLPLSEIDYLNDSLPMQEHKTHSPILIDGIPEDTLSMSEDKLLIPNIINSSPLPDDTILLTPVPDTSTDNKPHLISNLVTPISETVTSHIEDIPKNGLPLTMEDTPSKMDLMIPDICDVSSDDLSISDNDLPIMVHQEDTKNLQSLLSTNDLPMQLVETPLPEVPVSDPQNPPNQSSLSVDAVLVDDLPVLPASAILLSDLKSSSLDKLSDEMLSEPILSDILSNEPVDKTVSDADDIQIYYPIPTNKTLSTSKLPIAKALLKNVLFEIMKGALSSSVAKPMSATPPSLLDKSIYYLDKESPLSMTNEIPVLAVEEEFSIMGHTKHPIDNLQTLKNIDDTPTLYLPTDSPLSIDKTQTDKPDISTNDGKYVDIKSSVPENSKDSPPPQVDTILHNTTFSDLPTDNNNIPLSGLSDATMPLEVDKLLSEYSGTDTPKEISFPIYEILQNSNDVLTSSVTESLPPSSSPPLNNKIPSSSKLLITKALLENVLTDINEKGLSLPKAKVLPVANRSQLDKALYFLESPISDENKQVTEIDKDVSRLGETFPDSLNLDNPTDKSQIDKMSEDNLDILNKKGEDKESNETPFSGTSTDDTVDLLGQMEKQIPLTDMSDDLPTSGNNPYLSSRIPATKALLQKVLTDITDGGLKATYPNTQLTENNQRTKRMFRNN